MVTSVDRERAHRYLERTRSPGALREALAKDWAELAASAPTDIAAHAKLLHRTDQGRPITFPPHMQVWAHLAQAVEKYRWLVVVAPTSYAKTTFWSQIYPAWEIGRNPRVRVGLISNTANAAYANSKAIQQVIQNPLFRYAYGPETAPAPRSGDEGWGWAQEQWYVRGSAGPPHATVRAFGMDGDILGKRLDVIAMDDPTTFEQARSRATMEQQREKLHNTIVTRLPAGQRPPENRPGMTARMIVVCTRWSERDLIRDFEQLGFKIIVMPALGYWDAVKDPITGEWVWGTEPLWGDVESREQLLELQERYGTYFDLVWQGNAKAGSGGKVFSPDSFQRGVCPYPLMGSVTSWVDTSSGKSRERGDYFVMATLGSNRTLDDPGTETWVINVNRDRYSAPEQERQVQLEAEQLARMGCPTTAIHIATSNEGGASLYQRLVARTRLPLVEASEREDKEFRAIPLSNAYRQRWVHHDSAPWNRPFETELEMFPDGDHDDQVDSAAGAYREMAGGGAQLYVFHSRRPMRR